MQGIFHIAIDGLVASGKGTVAKELANRLGISCLDTGALYRGTALYMLQNNVAIHDESAVVNAAAMMSMTVVVSDCVTRIFLNNTEVTDQLRTAEVSSAASIIAYDGIRAQLTQIMRQVAQNQSFVVEGRDIALRVLPDAKYKFYLTAKPKVRAKRRLEQQTGSVDFKTMLREIKARDRRDRKRTPRVKSAIVIDNSNMTLDETLDAFIRHIVC